MVNDIMTIGLLSHYFTDNNLGCVALSICNIRLIDQAANAAGVRIRHIVYVNEKQPHWDLSGYTKNDFEYRVFTSGKQTLKHPIKWAKTQIFDDCDIVFNLCAGDGFTDIYGFGRVLSETYMSILASRKGARVVLSPQTIGPFEHGLAKAIARRTLSCCEFVFARDSKSATYCRELGYRGPAEEVIDVAFALPFEVEEAARRGNSPQIGLNVSGLLYAGGYDRNNYFELSFDYKEFINRLVPALIDRGFDVHLIAHVITEDKSIEDDFVVCSELHERYPATILMPRRESPIEVKSYISAMDAFIGARMHSTIGAYSAGVAVIPVAYSRKFNGLFDTLGYPYYIDARGSYTLQEALDKTLEYVEARAELKSCIDNHVSVYRSRLEEFQTTLAQILLKAGA